MPITEKVGDEKISMGLRLVEYQSHQTVLSPQTTTPKHTRLECIIFLFIFFSVWPKKPDVPNIDKNKKKHVNGCNFHNTQSKCS